MCQCILRYLLISCSYNKIIRNPHNQIVFITSQLRLYMHKQTTMLLLEIALVTIVFGITVPLPTSLSQNGNFQLQVLQISRNLHEGRQSEFKTSEYKSMICACISCAPMTVQPGP